MRFLLTTLRRHWIALAIALPILTLLFLVSGLFTWSPLNCWHQEIDINTGRLRRTRFLLYCQVNERTENTWLSRARDDGDAAPDWRRVNTFSPGVGHSPHYLYHGAINQIRTLETADAITPFDLDARRKVADTLITRWQNDGSYFDADEFVQQVALTALSLYENGAAGMTAADVPGGDGSSQQKPHSPQ